MELRRIARVDDIADGDGVVEPIFRTAQCDVRRLIKQWTVGYGFSEYHLRSACIALRLLAVEVGFSKKQNGLGDDNLP